MSRPLAPIEKFRNLLSKPGSHYNIVSAQQKECLSLELELHVFPTEKSARQVWHIYCKEVWGQRLMLGRHLDFGVYSDHPLLWEFIYPELALWFHGKPIRLAEIIGCLYQAHLNMVAAELPFERFYNPLPLPKLLAGGYGLLAQGPEPLVRSYQQVLEQQHISNSVLLFPRRRRYNTPEDSPLHVLKMDTSHVIYKEAEVRRE